MWVDFNIKNLNDAEDKEQLSGKNLEQVCSFGTLR
jgi:hypothetical protein